MSKYIEKQIQYKTRENVLQKWNVLSLPFFFLNCFPSIMFQWWNFDVKFLHKECTLILKKRQIDSLDMRNFVCQGLRLRCLNGIGYSNRIVERVKNETRRAVLYTVFNSWLSYIRTSFSAIFERDMRIKKEMSAS